MPRIASGYVAINLGTTGPLVVYSEARAINNSGQVVGVQAGWG